MIARIEAKPSGREHFARASLLSFIVCAAIFLPARPAWASIADDINGWLCGVLRDCCNWIFSQQANVLESIGYEGILGADFGSMLTTAGGTSMYDIVHAVWQVAILPIGCGVLSLVFTIKLIQISQRMDGSQSLPGVKEVVFLLVFFAVFLFLIQNSFELMQAIYEVMGLAIDRTIALFGTGGALDLGEVSIVTGDDDLPSLIAMLLVSLVSWLVVLVAYIVSLVVCWARALQLYIMAAFSPIPLSLMALDDTRQIGVGYIKNFAAVCIAGLIILILLVSFPLILGGLVAVNPGTGTPRQHRERPHLRAPVPGHVRPAHPLAREERHVGPRHRERVLTMEARRHTSSLGVRPCGPCRRPGPGQQREGPAPSRYQGKEKRRWPKRRRTPTSPCTGTSCGPTSSTSTRRAGRRGRSTRRRCRRGR